MAKKLFFSGDNLHLLVFFVHNLQNKLKILIKIVICNRLINNLIIYGTYIPYFLLRFKLQNQKIY